MRLIIFITGALFLYVPFFVFAAQSGDVTVNEIAYDIQGADDGHEWVEIYNATAGDIDVSGWKFNDGSNHILNVPPKNGGQGTMIMPVGGYGVLADDATIFLADHPGFSGIVIDTVMSLGNTSATLTLIDADGVSIDTVSYQKEWGAGGNGMTLARSGSGSWGESAQEGGTPGMPNGALFNQNISHDENETATTTPSVIEQQAPTSSVSSPQIIADAGENIVALTGEEVMFDASGTQGGVGATYIWNFGDGTVASGETIFHRYLFPGNYIVVLSVSGSEDTLEARVYPQGIVVSEFLPENTEEEKEWVEIHNNSIYSVDLSGWGLGTNNTKPKFIIPKGTAITSGGYLVLAQGVSDITLPNEKGMIVLWYPHGQQAMRVEYDNAKKDFSAARKNDGSYVWTNQRTPGTRNVFIVSEPTALHTIQRVSVNDNNMNSVPTLRGAWQRVHEDAGGSVRSFIAEPAHAMVYEESIQEGEDSKAIVPTALAYNAFSFSIVALVGILGMMLGILFMKRKKE